MTYWPQSAGVVSAAAILVAGILGFASPVFAGTAPSGDPSSLYAYAAGTDTSATSCPETTTASLECPLATALSLVKAGGTILLETPGATASYYGNFSVKTKSTSAAQPVTIADGAGASDPMIDGDASFAVSCPTSPACDGAALSVDKKRHVVLDSLTITDADDTAGNGGGIYDGGTLTLSDVTINDSAAPNGGAVYLGDEAHLTASNSTFDNDSSASGDGGDGGAIDSGDYGATGTVTVKKSSFTSDTGLHDGAAISSGDHGGSGTLAVSHCTFSDDSQSYGDGGAIDSGDYSGSSGTLTVTDSTFDNDSSPIDGGAIDSGDHGATGDLSVSGSTFSDDTSPYGGGAVGSGANGGSANLMITGSSFTGDTTISYGGAVDTAGTGSTPASITGSTFDTDSAAGGGAIGNGDDDTGTLTVSDSSFTDDSVNTDGVSDGDGGAIDNGDSYGNGTLTVTDSTFSDDNGQADSLDSDGGAIDNGDNDGDGTLTVMGSTFSGDSSTSDGGAIDNGDDDGFGTTTISDSTFTDDAASNDGGAVDNGDFDGDGTISVISSTLIGNGGSETLDNHDGTLAIAGSIVAGSQTADCAGSVVDDGYNYENDASTSCGFSSAAHDVVGGTLDLGPLQNNGGLTETFEPGSDSVLIDRIPNPTSVTVGSTSFTLCPGTDQRGVTASAKSVLCTIGSVDVSEKAAITPSVIQSDNVSAPSGQQTTENEPCPAGTFVLGGGEDAADGSGGAVNSSYPADNGWQVRVDNTSGLADTFTVYAVCSPEPSGYEVVASDRVTNPAGAHSKLGASCPAGTNVLGGGGSSSSASMSVDLDDSYPDGGSWKIAMNNDSGSSAEATAYAICASDTLGYAVQSYEDSVTPGTDSELYDACLPGSVATGGGVASSSNSLENYVNAVFPSGSESGSDWDMYWFDGTDSSLDATSYVVCVYTNAND
jgi:hypothetical protein